MTWGGRRGYGRKEIKKDEKEIKKGGSEKRKSPEEGKNEKVQIQRCRFKT